MWVADPGISNPSGGALGSIDRTIASPSAPPAVGVASCASAAGEISNAAATRATNLPVQRARFFTCRFTVVLLAEWCEGRVRQSGARLQPNRWTAALSLTGEAPPLDAIASGR